MLVMRPSLYGTIAGLIFLGVAVLHGVRATYGWEVMINGWMVPLWLSWLIALVGFLMALTAIRSLR